MGALAPRPPSTPGPSTSLDRLQVGPTTICSLTNGDRGGRDDCFMVSLPGQPPEGRTSWGSAAVNRLGPVHSSTLRMSRNAGGGASSWGRGYLLVGAGPLSRLRVAGPLPRGRASSTDLSRDRESYSGAGPLPSGEPAHASLVGRWGRVGS